LSKKNAFFAKKINISVSLFLAYLSSVANRITAALLSIGTMLLPEAASWAAERRFRRIVRGYIP